MVKLLTIELYLNNSPYFLVQAVALNLLSTRYGKVGAEKVEHSLLNADLATIRRKKKRSYLISALSQYLLIQHTLSLQDLKSYLEFG